MLFASSVEFDWLAATSAGGTLGCAIRPKMITDVTVAVLEFVKTVTTVIFEDVLFLN